MPLPWTLDKRTRLCCQNPPANNRLQPYSIVKGPKYRFNSLDEDVRSELTQPLVQTANESVTIFTLRRF